MSRDNLIVLIGIVLILIGGFIAFELWTKEEVQPNDKHEQQQSVIDSLTLELELVQQQRDSFKTKFKESDSTAKAFMDSLRTKFNDNEKDKRIRIISDAPDSTRQSFFSKWVSEDHNN